MGEKKLEYTTIADYLAFELESEFRHEYSNGEIIAMSGGTLNHGRIGRNIISILDGITKNGNCETINNDVKLYIDKHESFVYPDAYVVCGELETAEFDDNSVVNPVLVVEVLSKSTEAYDRGDKFRKYRSLSSFKEYVLVTQDEPIVETFFKNKEDMWIMNTIIGLDKEVYLRSIDVKISMAEIYRNITTWKEELPK